MSGVPRSQNLIRWHGTAPGNSALWLSPNGYVTLVKSAQFWNEGAAAVTVQLICGSQADAIAIKPFIQEIQPGATAAWEGWVVLNPNDYVYVYANGGSLYAWVDGAVLAGPNQFPPVMS